MELSVHERIVLLGILPEKGDITSVKIVRELREALSFTEQELVDFEIVVDDNNIVWKNNDEKDIVIGPKASSIILEELEKLNKQKLLTEEHIPVYDKFVEGEE